jgi:hypothetical protein
MKYFYIRRPMSYLGTSKLGIGTANKGLVVSDDTFIEYDSKIRLDVHAEAEATELCFLKYVQQSVYRSHMVPELKKVFE